MDNKKLHYLFAGASFLISFLVYLATMQPTIPFWDCGEFAAAAWGLQVGHPPGSPLWSLIGRVAMMLPTSADLVARYNLVSVVCSALTVMILYLTVVRLIKMWRGEPKNMAGVVAVFGGAFVAAMSFTFTDSFWFNALESEVYAFGSLFIALIPWIMLVWYDHADEEHSEKYILLVSYIIGLSMTVHQLALLTIFPVFMLVYYRRRKEFTYSSFAGMMAASIIAFFIAYKVVLSKLVEWMATTPIISIGLIVGCIAGIIYSQREKKALLNLSLWSAMLMFLGFTTYTLIMVRAAQEPPMNQWHADNFKSVTKFINREQYGDRGQFPRRQALEPGDEQKGMFKNYSSDMDFFIKYQTNHMYNRYLLWNFVGRVSQKQDTGVDWSKTWGIPFLIGLFGMYWHFRRDPKRALSMFVMFLMLGWLTAWYQNQQEPQPRERDYFYVGAFYVYAMWVGIGATGLIELLARKKKKNAEGETDTADEDTSDGNLNTGLAFGLFAGAMLLAPINQCIGLAGLASGKSFKESSKWAEYDRSNNYIPFEYAYNVLQSCEENAILFTAGDNDTFPLWCMQDVYGVRRDIRIVNLSLGNMSWYIKQLLSDVWGVGKKLTLPGFSLEQLNAPDDSQEGVHGYQGEPANVSVDISAQTMQTFSNNPQSQATQMRWVYTGQYNLGQGKYYFTVADQLVKSVIEGNINNRPIYFAGVVPENYYTGLRDYVVSEGLAKRVAPIMFGRRGSRLEETINEPVVASMFMNFVTEPSKTPKRGLLLNTFMDPSANWSNEDRTNEPSFFSYQNSYANLAAQYLANEEYDKAKKVLDVLKQRIPPERVRYNGMIATLLSQQLRKVGDTVSARSFARSALKDYEEEIVLLMEKNIYDEGSLGQYLFGSETYILLGEPETAAAILSKVLPNLPNKGESAQFELRLMQAQAMILEKKGDKKGAYAKYEELFAKYGNAMGATPGYQEDFQALVMKRYELMDALGIQQVDTMPTPPNAQ